MTCGYSAEDTAFELLYYNTFGDAHSSKFQTPRVQNSISVPGTDLVLESLFMKRHEIDSMHNIKNIVT